MRILPAAHVDTLKSVTDSLNYNIRRVDIATRIRDDLPQITFEARAFDYSTADPSAAKLQAAEYDDGLKESMVWLYENSFGTRDAAYIRDDLLSLGLGGCPYCHGPLAISLDHMYPKALFPRLAVTPRNLIPCCRDCNEERGRTAVSIDLDPYSDTWSETDQWMVADVPDPSDPAIIRYSTKSPIAWSPDQRARVEGLFSNAKFAFRFELAASQEFYRIVADLADVYSTGGLDSVEQSLEREFRMSSGRSVNHWAAAAYCAWFRRARDIDWVASRDLYRGR